MSNPFSADDRPDETVSDSDTRAPRHTDTNDSRTTDAPVLVDRRESGSDTSTTGKTSRTDVGLLHDKLVVIFRQFFGIDFPKDSEVGFHSLPGDAFDEGDGPDQDSLKVRDDNMKQSRSEKDSGN